MSTAKSMLVVELCLQSQSHFVIGIFCADTPTGTTGTTGTTCRCIVVSSGVGPESGSLCGNFGTATARLGLPGPLFLFELLLEALLELLGLVDNSFEVPVQILQWGGYLQ